MCGIAGLQLRDPGLDKRLGELLSAMLGQLCERGPDSAGVGLYGDATLARPGWSTVSVLLSPGSPATGRSSGDDGGSGDGVLRLPDGVPPPAVTTLGDLRVISAALPLEALLRAVRAAYPGGVLLSIGNELAVLKGVGDPRDLAAGFGLAARSGYQGVGHTRMATESAVTVAHGHPFSVATDLCLVHNGSFANHATIRRELERAGIGCDTDNDSEVAARFVGWRLALGDGLEDALRLLCERFDGFYTLLVTTAHELAVVRDSIACKPALVAQTPEWVAMASEYRALAVLPGIERARVFEPGPNEVHLWAR